MQLLVNDDVVDWTVSHIHFCNGSSVLIKFNSIFWLQSLKGEMGWYLELSYMIKLFSALIWRNQGLGTTLDIMCSHFVVLCMIVNALFGCVWVWMYIWCALLCVNGSEDIQGSTNEWMLDGMNDAIPFNISRWNLTVRAGQYYSLRFIEIHSMH